MTIYPEVPAGRHLAGHPLARFVARLWVVTMGTTRCGARASGAPWLFPAATAPGEVYRSATTLATAGVSLLKR